MFWKSKHNFLWKDVYINPFKKGVIATYIVVAGKAFFCHILPYFLEQLPAAGSESEHQGPLPTSSLPLLLSSNQSTWSLPGTLLTSPDTLLQLHQRPFSDILVRLSRVPIKGPSTSVCCAAKRQRGPETSPPYLLLLLSRRLAPLSAGPSSDPAISKSTQDLEELSIQIVIGRWKSIWKQYLTEKKILHSLNH